MTPLCECHGEPMYCGNTGKGRWLWRCRIEKRERDNRYRRTEKGRKQSRGRIVRETARKREAQITRLKELRGQ